MIKKKKRIVENHIFTRVEIKSYEPRCLECCLYEKYKQCPNLHLGIICDIANFNVMRHFRFSYVII